MGFKASKETSNVDEDVASYVIDIFDILKSVKTWMKKMKDNLESDVKQSRMNPESAEFLRKILKLYDIKENRKLVGDQLAVYNAGEILTEYVKFMTSYGANTSTNRYDETCLEIVLSVCWNYSDASNDFRLDLGRAGLFKYLVANLHALYDRRDEENANFTICGCLATLHNCSKEAENRKYFMRADAIEAVTPYTKTKCQLVSVLSTLTLAYLIEEKDSEFVATNNSMIKTILEYLKLAIKSPDHRGDGFSAEELVDGLAHLANNESNKKKIVKEGVLPMLVELMQNGSCSEQDASAKMVWVLSFVGENKAKIRQEENMMKSLSTLAKTTGHERAKGALWVLKEEALVDEKKISESKTEKKQVLSRAEKENNTTEQLSSTKHIMISYQWNYKNIATEIKKLLESRNYSVRMDVGNMDDFSIETMPKAVENSDVILICVSETYKNSVTCRTEAEYANWLKKCFIPIMVDQDYHLDGWLGVLIGSKFVHDFSNNDLLVRNFPKLVEELDKKGKYDTTDGVIERLDCIREEDKEESDKRIQQHSNE